MTMFVKAFWVRATERRIVTPYGSTARSESMTVRSALLPALSLRHFSLNGLQFVRRPAAYWAESGAYQENDLRGKVERRAEESRGVPLLLPRSERRYFGRSTIAKR